MDENHRVAAGEHEIGPPRQLGPMEPVAIAERVDDAPNRHLGSGILTPDAGHTLAALFGSERVWHRCTI